MTAPAGPRFVAYYRVSTDAQGRSGLGVEAQKQAVLSYLNGGSWELVGEFTEVESGKRSDRPKLTEALALCRVYGAKLVIAKLDRLSRDAHFLLGLQKAGVPFVAADMPYADSLTVGVLALVAQKEREMISQRTKAALAAAKARGKMLGGFRAGARVTDEARQKAAQAKAETVARKAADLMPTIKAVQAEGAMSLRQIAAALTSKGVPTPGGGNGPWNAAQVQRVLIRQGWQTRAAGHP